VKVSGYLVNKLGDLTLRLAKRISASAERRIGQSSQKGAGVFHDVVTVGGAGIGGAAAVYVTLENAARVLAKSIANETVLVVDHRFGEEAASVAKDVSYSAYNSVVAYQNVESLGIRAIAKRTAKHTGIQLLKDLSGSSKQPKLEAAGSDSKQLAIEDKKTGDEKKKK